jgi:8-oxo-dGTP diphosphatase
MITKTLRRALIYTIPRIINIFGLSLPPLPSVCAIIKNKNKILAVDLSYKDGLNLPGGAMKHNETLEEALSREIKEETNLDVIRSKYLGSKKVIHGKISQVSACFLVKVKSFNKLKSSNEGKALWVDPQDLYNNCAYPDVKKHLKDYFSLP